MRRWKQLKLGAQGPAKALPATREGKERRKEGGRVEAGAVATAGLGACDPSYLRQENCKVKVFPDYKFKISQDNFVKT